MSGLTFEEALSVPWIDGISASRENLLGLNVYASREAAEDPRSAAVSRLVFECMNPQMSTSRVRELAQAAQKLGLDLNEVVLPVATQVVPDCKGAVCVSLMPAIAALAPATVHGAGAIKELARCGVDPASQFVTFASGEQLPFYQIGMTRNLVAFRPAAKDRILDDVLSSDITLLRAALFDRWFRAYAEPPPPVEGLPGAFPLPALSEQQAADILEAGAVMGGEWDRSSKASVEALSGSIKPIRPQVISLDAAADRLCPFASASSVFSSPSNVLAVQYGIRRCGSQAKVALDTAKMSSHLVGEIRQFRIPKIQGNTAFSVAAVADFLHPPSAAKDAWTVAQKTITATWSADMPPVLSSVDGSSSLTPDEMVMAAEMSGLGVLSRPSAESGALRSSRPLPQKELDRERRAFEKILDGLHPEWRTGVSSAGRPYSDIIPLMLTHFQNVGDLGDMVEWSVRKTAETQGRGLGALRKFLQSYKESHHAKVSPVLELLDEVAPNQGVTSSARVSPGKGQ